MVGGLEGQRCLGRCGHQRRWSPNLAVWPPAQPATSTANLPPPPAPAPTAPGGLLGVPVSLNGSARFPAILDLGANFSILNWPAAELAGVRRGADGAPADSSMQEVGAGAAAGGRGWGG